MYKAKFRQPKQYALVTGTSEADGIFADTIANNSLLQDLALNSGIFRAGRYADCPGDAWHQLLCCTLPNFYYGHCMKYGSAHGELNSCLSHGNVPYLLEGMLVYI